MNATRRGQSSFFVPLALVGIVGCGLADDMRELVALQEEITRQHGVQVSVSLNNSTHLRIDVLNAGDSVRLGEHAITLVEAIARTAYVAYPKRDSLIDVAVWFTETSEAGPVSRTMSYKGKAWNGAALYSLRDSASTASPPDSGARAPNDGW